MHLLVARKGLAPSVRLLIRVVRVQNTALCERAINTYTHGD